MKKNLLLILSIVVSFPLFISCNSDDEDDDEENNTSTTIFLDGSQQSASVLLSGISYTNKNVVDETELSISIYGDEDSNLIFFTMLFPNVTLDNIKVGDDLVKLSDRESYILGRNDEKELYMIGEGSELEDGTPVYGTGSVIVKEFDQKKGFMKVEFKDVTVYNIKYPINGKFTKVKGEIASIIDITLYNK